MSEIFVYRSSNNVEIKYRLVDKSVWTLAGRRGIMEEDVWGQCRNETGFFERMAEIDVEKPSKSLAYCIGGGEPGKSPWLIGVETESDNLDGLDTMIIPETKYLVFEAHGPMDPNFFNMQNEVYNGYFQDSYRKYDWHDGMRSFEKYCTENAHSEDTLIELWCPVVER
ncbi:MAG: effector binding domain-containing protein [Clostridia bacterium]|nr:effector binding domain-containing protein [Clostridia bacterium]